MGIDFKAIADKMKEELRSLKKDKNLSSKSRYCKLYDFWFHTIGVNCIPFDSQIKLLMRTGLHGRINQFLTRYMKTGKKLVHLIRE